MKAKGLRKILISLMCSMCIVSGAVAYAGFNTGSARADDTPPAVTVSEDIQKIIDGFKNAKTSAGGTSSGITAVEYVQDQVLLDGTTKVSGIKLTFTHHTSSSTADTLMVFPNFNINVSTLTATDSLLGFVALPSSYEDKPFSALAVHCYQADAIKGFTYHIWNDTSTAGKPYSDATVRIINGNESAPFNAGMYYNSTGHDRYKEFVYATVGHKSASLTGYRTEPFNVYYDYSQNAVYSTRGDSNATFDNKHFDMLLNVDPTTWASSGFVDKYGEVTNLVNFTGTIKQEIGNTKYTTPQYFKGFENGKARLGLRVDVNAGKTGSVILTSYAGIDLTNPTNTAPAKNVISVDTSEYVAEVGVATKLPEADYSNYFSGKNATAFTGKVNIYKGSTLAEENFDVANNYTFAEHTTYTIEYINANGGANVKVTVNPILASAKITTTDLASKFVYADDDPESDADDNVVTATYTTATALGSGVDFTGLKLTVTPTADVGEVTVNYKDTVNLSSLWYKNKTDNSPLIGLVPVPANKFDGVTPNNETGYKTMPYTNEFSAIELILTDALDSSVQVHVKFMFAQNYDGARDGAYSDGKTYNNSVVYVWASKDGTDITGDRAYGYSYGVRYAGVRSLSMLGYQTESLGIVYDYESNSMFTTVAGNKNDNMSKSYLLKMFGVPATEYSKYTDPDNGGKYHDSTTVGTKTWDGFKSGNVNVSLKLTLQSYQEGAETKYRTGNLMITDFLGLDLSNINSSNFAYSDAVYDYIDLDEAISETSNPNTAFTVPAAKHKSNFAQADATHTAYTGKVAVSLNGTSLGEKNVGDTVNFNKPGVYTFKYLMNNGRYTTYSTKVNAETKVVINGLGSIFAADGEEILNNGVISSYEGITLSQKAGNNYYLSDVSIKTQQDANANDLGVTKGSTAKLNFAIGDLGFDNVITVTFREYYTVNYYSFGKIYHTEKVMQGESPSGATAPVVTGYGFDYWFNGQDDAGNDIQFNTSTVLDVNSEAFTGKVISVNGKFTPINYNATLYIESAFGSMADFEGGSATGTFNIESDLNGLTLPTINETYANDFVFGGWIYEGNLVSSGSELPSENVTLYASLVKKFNTIIYKEKSGDTETILDTATVTKGEKTFASEITKDGYLLEGWYTDEALTNKFAFGSTIEENVTLYAKYVKIDSNTVKGDNSAIINGTPNKVSDTEISALNGIDTVGIVSLAVTGVSVLGAIAMAVLLILKKRK